MPEGRLQRTRETLPEGYQFGDADLFEGGHRHDFARFNPHTLCFECPCGVWRDRHGLLRPLASEQP